MNKKTITFWKKEENDKSNPIVINDGTVVIRCGNKKKKTKNWLESDPRLTSI